jgi:hypothetical protein
MPDLAEDRRLKAFGIALLVLSGLGFAWLADHAAAQWPPAVDRLAVFVAGVAVSVNLLVAGVLVVAAGCGGSRPWRDPRRRRAVLLQVLLANVLVPAVLYGMLTAEASTEAALAEGGWDVAFSLGGTALGLVAWRMWRRAQRNEAPDAAEAMAADPRPPVLYLRSFQDDGVPVLDDGGSTLARRFMALLAPQTPEQELAIILNQVGPVVAIGKPGEPLPELGAARLYVDDSRWQAEVATLMRRAALVVVRVGASPGVLWEIDQALEVIPRQRLVLTVLGGAAVAPALVERLERELGRDLAAALPQPLPTDWIERAWQGPRRRLGGVVCFGADGAPRTVPVSLWPPWGRDMFTVVMLRPSAMPLRRAWRQVFAILGIEAGAMSGRPSRAMAVVLAILFGWVGAHWFYLGNRRRGWTYVLLLPLALASAFCAYYDALRFVWVDRATFDARFVGTPQS